MIVFGHRVDKTRSWTTCLAAERVKPFAATPAVVAALHHDVDFSLPPPDPCTNRDASNANVISATRYRSGSFIGPPPHDDELLTVIVRASGATGRLGTVV